MKRDLRHTIYESVSTLRNLFVKLKEVSECKSRKITELQALVSTTKTELEGARENTPKTLATPSIARSRENEKGRVGRGIIWCRICETPHNKHE
jgi:hypothetical protein